MHTVQGNFQITDPWWGATILVRGRGGKKSLYNGYPKYHLRDDAELHNVFTSFFIACSVNRESANTFLTELE